ncbi:MAG: glycoside hydrolase family 2 TIM barrel-domain containing protein [Saccharofermentanales bacterium]|jgi:beta-galactosidase
MICSNFNSKWKFWEEINAFALIWSIPDDAREIILPHDAMLERRPYAQSPNGGATGYRDGGNYVYAKHFFAPEDWREKTIALRFDGVYRNALVYLNGRFLVSQPYGYSVFRAELNDALRYGEENELRVLVKNGAMPNSRWYTGSGIYRDVHLLVGGTIYIPDGSLKITTEHLESDGATVSIAFDLHNREHLRRDVTVQLRLLKPDGSCVEKTKLPVSLAGSARETISRRVTVRDPLCWSAETPWLYRCDVRVLHNGAECDRTEEIFGIRTLTLDSVRGLRVNSKPVKLRGACIHHDHGILGSVTYYDAEYRRIKKLKDAGFNAIRAAHNPAAPVLLRACDKLGMYVMDEAFDMWTRPKKDNDYSLFFDRWWRSDLTAMVEKNYNHPSVILYSLGNEIPEIGTPQGTALSREMARLVRRLDPTRYCLVSINGVFAAGDQVQRILSDIFPQSPQGEAEGDVNDFMTALDTHMDEIVRHPVISDLLENAETGLDVVGYNYMASRYETDAVNHPNRIMVGSETYPTEIPRNWELVKEIPSLIGDFTWTGWDYLGEAGLGIPAYAVGEGGFGAQYPCQLAYCGDLDITGFRRPASYLRELVFGLRTEPYITVQRPEKYGQPLIKTPWILGDNISCWTYPGMEDRPVVVEVYAAGDTVVLLRNGESLGVQKAGEAAGYIARFRTTYQPGVLEAVSYQNGNAIGKSRLVTAEEPFILTAEPESGIGTEDGLFYISVTHSDQNGITAACMDSMVSVAESENIQLLGFGNGDPKPLYHYLDAAVPTFHGRALLVVRKTDPALPGHITLTSRLGRRNITL